MAKKKTSKRVGRPYSKKTDLDPQHRLTFLVSPYVMTGMSRFAREIEKREGKRLSEHELARRIVNATMLEWMRQVDRGDLDLQDPKWRPPC
jgi:hypothetical protein